jgi:hypothetical protein
VSGDSIGPFHHQSRQRGNRSFLRLARRHGGNAATRGCSPQPCTFRFAASAAITTHRLTFASFPIIGYSLTSDTVPRPNSGKWRLTN